MPVSLHSSSQDGSTGASSASWSHVGPSSAGLYDMVLVLTGIFQNPAPTVTYGGQALTEISAVANNYLRAFYRINPLAGTQTVSVSVGSAISYIRGVCLYLQGVDTDNPFSATATNSVTHSDTGGPNTLSVSLSSWAAQHYLVSSFQFSNGTYLSVSGASLLHSNTNLFVATNLNGDTPVSPKTVTWSYNRQPDTYRTHAIAIAPKILGNQMQIGGGVVGL
ncbi:MAG: hypothetical protein WHV44_00255 [Anaerolineales bacterium]